MFFELPKIKLVVRCDIGCWSVFRCFNGDIGSIVVKYYMIKYTGAAIISSLPAEAASVSLGSLAAPVLAAFIAIIGFLYIAATIIFMFKIIEREGRIDVGEINESYICIHGYKLISHIEKMIAEWIHNNQIIDTGSIREA